MLIFRESGRLGNQIFQYAALRSLCKEKEKLLLLGFSDLDATFDGINAKIINIDSPKFERSLYYKSYPHLDWLSVKGLIGRVSEKEQTNQYELVQKQGFFNSIKFVEQAYFQNKNLLCQEAIKKLIFKSSLSSNTKILLKTISPSRTNIFVHIRRGDYLFWPSKENPAILPDSYYKECIDIICSKIYNPFFYFTSDDSFYVENTFSDLKDSYISQGSSIEDFALMSHCHGGILSASSFSWWAAYLAHSNHPNGIFLAPEYWAGHSLNSWFPSTIKSQFLNYIKTRSNS
jgi:Glycosyl transferase family 11